MAGSIYISVLHFLAFRSASFCLAPGTTVPQTFLTPPLLIQNFHFASQLSFVLGIQPCRPGQRRRPHEPGSSALVEQSGKNLSCGSVTAYDWGSCRRGSLLRRPCSTRMCRMYVPWSQAIEPRLGCVALIRHLLFVRSCRSVCRHCEPQPAKMTLRRL